MEKIGAITTIPLERIGIGKWKFVKFFNGTIRVYKVTEDEDSLVDEFSNNEDLVARGESHGFQKADLCFLSRFL